MAFVVALTGGIGSGKTTVADLLAQYGAAIVDTDAIAHQLTAPGQVGALAIAAGFGPEYIRPDGALNRDRMRELVFSDSAAKQKLEAILHPMIRAEVDAQTASAATHSPYTVIVVPLLVETGAYRRLARRILVVDCNEEQQVARVMRRSKLSAAEVRAVMAHQVSRADRLARADDVVVNDGDLSSLRAEVSELHTRYLRLASAETRSEAGK